MLQSTREFTRIFQLSLNMKVGKYLLRAASTKAFMQWLDVSHKVAIERSEMGILFEGQTTM